MYLQINSAAFSCPFWFSPDAKSLIERLLDPNPKTVSIQLYSGKKKVEKFSLHPSRFRYLDLKLETSVCNYLREL